MKNVVRVDRNFDEPLPPEAKDLDAIFIVLFYHDFVWQKVDRKKLDQNLLAALKPGGELIIVDHSAAAGHGLNDVETFHRIEEPSLVNELTAAGFVKDAEADFLRNPKDTRDWNDSPHAAADRRGTSDRFVIRFKKPA
jgi:predicted methyltransferase